MSREFENFVQIYLDLECAYDTKEGLHDTLHSFKPSYVEAVRKEMEAVLGERSMSLSDYEGLTSIEFEDEDSLYEYLDGIYRHLFGGLSHQPAPPV
ncbi:hypothetical protein SNA_38620 [Streptomyces natalensis ATCC 27448]|uniref:CdiI immunity protein domain-containing protein n=1 Tax=Streptomyces natalensis ATCC 27448 TaxID=1240678 RepID=A0A0D7CAS2_9ACTN|nr:hypothetical protein SNA_38620 [Streptomyces natalensis ATCC 27448]